MNKTNTSSASEAFQYLRKSKVKEETGIDSDGTLYNLISKGDFPRPYKLSKRLVAWKSNEIEEWKRSRPQSELKGGEA